MRGAPSDGPAWQLSCNGRPVRQIRRVSGPCPPVATNPARFCFRYRGGRRHRRLYDVVITLGDTGAGCHIEVYRTLPVSDDDPPPFAEDGSRPATDRALCPSARPVNARQRTSRTSRTGHVEKRRNGSATLPRRQVVIAGVRKHRRPIEHIDAAHMTVRQLRDPRRLLHRALRRRTAVHGHHDLLIHPAPP